MGALRRLAREIHRRSPWRVLGVFALGSWAVLLGVDYLTDVAGLPGWTPDLAKILLLIGLPVVTITALVQRGAAGLIDRTREGGRAHNEPRSAPKGTQASPERRSPRHLGLFTWRNAILGGVGAGALLVASVTAYLAMWASGVGPMGSLVAQGMLDEHDPVVLADLENRTDDSTLGEALTGALRIDLTESEVFSLVERGLVRDALEGMGRPGDQLLTAGVAREVAVREGIKAVVEGEVSRRGAGYLLAVRVVAADDGRSVAEFLETATDPGDLLRATDRIGQRLREKAGESLRDIRAGEPLEAVTTSSLDAWRRFSQAERATREGDVERAIELLEESVVLDSTFAMAYRMLAVQHAALGGDSDARARAATLAYENRDRLTERERHLTEAYYHSSVTGDQEEVARAYRRVLDSHPNDRVALNDLAVIHLGWEEWGQATELLERAVRGPARSRSAFHNLVVSLYNEGRKEEAVRVLDRWSELYPTEYGMVRDRLIVAWGMGDLETAETVAVDALEALSGDVAAQVRLQRQLGFLYQAQGRLGEAREHLRDALALAEAQGRPGMALDVAADIAWVDALESGTPRELVFPPHVLAIPDGVGDAASGIARLEAFVSMDRFSFVDLRERQLGDVLAELARRYEEVGRTGDAGAAWMQLAERWQGADDSLQPRVSAARASVERLAGL